MRQCQPCTLSAALVLVAALPLTAQPRVRVTGSFETGAAAIEQPLVPRGAAVYVAPAATLTARDASIGASVVLAAGSPAWQSVLGTGFIQSPTVRNTRLIGTAQSLATTGIERTMHADIGAEWRATRGAYGGAARLSTGQLRHSGAWWRDVTAGASAARTRGTFSAVLDASFTDARRPRALQEQIGGLAAGTALLSPLAPLARLATRAQVLDITPRMIWERSRLRTDASVALRAVEGGLRGARIGPQLAFTLQTARGISLFAGGVQRLPDVRSGVPSGRSALIGMRIELRRAFSADRKTVQTVPALRVEQKTLLVDAGATATYRVELRGDFTDWQPRACTPRGRRYFDCGAAPVAGTWRVSVRLNEGDWQPPANLPPIADDFGSVDGVLLSDGKR